MMRLKICGGRKMHKEDAEKYARQVEKFNKKYRDVQKDEYSVKKKGVVKYRKKGKKN